MLISGMLIKPGCPSGWSYPLTKRTTKFNLISPGDPLEGITIIPNNEGIGDLNLIGKPGSDFRLGSNLTVNNFNLYNRK